LERIRGEAKSFRKQLIFCKHDQGWDAYLVPDVTREEMERTLADGTGNILGYITWKPFEHSFKIRVYNPHSVRINLSSYLVLKMGDNELIQMESFAYNKLCEQCQGCEHWKGEGPFKYCDSKERELDGFTCRTFEERIPISKKTFSQIILEFLGLK